MQLFLDFTFAVASPNGLYYTNTASDVYRTHNIEGIMTPGLQTTSKRGRTHKNDSESHSKVGPKINSRWLRQEFRAFTHKITPGHSNGRLMI
ncbi:hypothetical protein NPIL_453871 [Nephila pilipes]|uniref:Uncharacterized protein n=1 Tax=Nephila pilipes TaxID=299642 RepID=A0A8X6U2J3_NEPPI|nr:hypothetical protein NPIL_453871 [Nephila pilipes]